MTVRCVPSRVLLLTEKRYADTSRGIICDYKVSSPAAAPQTPRLSKGWQDLFIKLLPPGFGSPALEPDDMLNKEVSGAYQEFEVETTNDRGEKRVRILGADRYYIYNKSKKSTENFLGSTKCTMKSGSDAALAVREGELGVEGEPEDFNEGRDRVRAGGRG